MLHVIGALLKCFLTVHMFKAFGYSLVTNISKERVQSTFHHLICYYTNTSATSKNVRGKRQRKWEYFHLKLTKDHYNYMYHTQKCTYPAVFLS